MPRLLIHVEGQTEEAFVNEILAQHLLARGYHSVAARIVGNARLRRRRGGVRPWPSVRKDILNHLKADSGCIATTMVDYYGLPQQGPGAWPGRANAAVRKEKAACVEDALLKDVVKEIDNPRRFVPFVLMHEFESLLFSDCDALSRGIERPDLKPKFESVRQQFATPEEINDSPETAPSKRMEAIVYGYEKPLLGILAVLEIGLDRIRAECPHFDGWLSRLESLVSGRGSALEPKGIGQ
jgi:hypothetical protein